MRAALCLALLTLAACDPSNQATDPDPDSGTDSASGTDTTAPGDFDFATLTQAGGCSDVVFYKLSADGTAALVFTATGQELTKASYDAGAAVSQTFDLSAEASLQLWQGVELGGLVCNDALTGNEVKELIWSATAGSAYVTVTTTGDGSGAGWGAYPASGHLELTGVTLTAPDDGTLSLDSLAWDANVGWLPG